MDARHFRPRRSGQDHLASSAPATIPLHPEKGSSMNRIALAACLLTAALGTACQSTLDAPPRMPDTADLRVTASVAGTPIDLIVVICESADIPTPLVFNLPVQNGVAQGTIKLPPGSQRKITVKAYDTDGALIAEGTKTIDVRPGMNPPVSIPMVSKAGQVPVTVTLGAVSVVVQPALPTMTTGGTLQLSTTITDRKSTRLNYSH